MYINKVSLYGFIKDIKAFEKSIKFSLYTARKSKDKVFKEYHSITSYNKIYNDFFLKYAKDGMKAYVEGFIYTSKYTDKNGVEHKKVDICVDPYSGRLDLELGETPVKENEPQQDIPAADDNGDDEIPF